MWPYWFLFSLPAFLAMAQKPSYRPVAKKWPYIWWVGYFLLVLMIGLRFEVGGDWFNYARQFDFGFHDFSFDAVIRGDPSYKLLMWLAAKWCWLISSPL
jgi:EpsG family